MWALLKKQPLHNTQVESIAQSLEFEQKWTVSRQNYCCMKVSAATHKNTMGNKSVVWMEQCIKLEIIMKKQKTMSHSWEKD